MYFNWKRYIVSLLILIGCDIAFGYLFGALGIGGIYYVLGISLVMSFVIALINFSSYSFNNWYDLFSTESW